MDSPIPSVVAHLFMKNIETWASETSTFVEKICRLSFCNHEEIKVVRILDTSEHNRKLYPIHSVEKEKEGRLPFFWQSID